MTGTGSRTGFAPGADRRSCPRLFLIYADSELPLGARVLVYSGRAHPEEHKAAFDAGADACVNKPHLTHLATTVKDLLR